MYSWSTLLWHRCYYPHRSRDSMSPVCRIFNEEIFFICWIYIICFLSGILKSSRESSKTSFLNVWNLHFCTTFQNCPRDGHVAAFITFNDLLQGLDWRCVIPFPAVYKKCAAGNITKHTFKCKTCVWALWWISFPSMCFFNAPNKLSKHNIHRDIKLEFVILAYHVLSKKLPKSGYFPH